MVLYKRPLVAGLVILSMIAVLRTDLSAQSAVDTLYLDQVPPDSFAVYRDGRNIVIRWYAPHDSISSGIGTIDFRNWYSGYNPSEVSELSTYGNYTGMIDRKIRIERQVTGLLLPLQVGVDPYILIRIETIDPVNRSYAGTFNIGASYYTPGTPFSPILVNEADESDRIDLGFQISFGAGIIDTSLAGAGALIEMDLQDFEGFHVWRGVKPYPSDMISIAEISKEDYFLLSDIDVSIEVPRKWLWLWEYFRGTPTREAWPRYDAQGREYYEWIDTDVFPGFTYYYHVTCYDRGFFKGYFQYNKRDNFICDEEIDDPDNPLSCDAVARSIEMTVETGGDTDKDMMNVYAVPNPYRTGTSSESTPSYHNYPDNAIKFFNVPSQCELRIFTVAGDLVWETKHESLDGQDGIISWDVKNKEGNEVGSGVYIFRCESNTGGSVYGRVVVIR
ncbi:MAG: hypothetical protein L0213_06875 [Candidatus Dadabacteria bacterium]|nr:hypothetical protein [Candidatus Dadabacteria bacterium]